MKQVRRFTGTRLISAGRTLWHSLETGSKTARALTLMLLLVPFSAAQAASGLNPFPLAEQESENRSQPDQQLLATGRIQNKGGEPFPESWLTLPAGALTQTLYRIRSTRDTDEIMEHYRSQLQRPGSELLFQCSSRECGSSTDWANRVFKVSTLYGVDRKQHYMAGRQEHKAGVDYYSVYITERGTGRIYAYVTRYQVDSENARQQGTAQTLFQQLNERGWVRLPVTADGEFEEGASGQLRQLTGRLQQSDDRYWLVAHHYGTQSDEQLLQRSERAAARLQRALQAFGLDSGKLELKGLGALAPTRDSVAYGGRIELVIQR